MFYLSFFSGALGLDIGLERQGFIPALYCENNKDCQETIKLNRPHIPVISDIMNTTSSEIIKHALTDSIKLIAGGPPCQSFSTAGKRHGFSDIRGNAFLKFLDICVEIKPKYIIIENVRGLLSASHNNIKNGAIRYVQAFLESHGYSVSYNLYNAAHYGVAQIRERVVILCVLNDVKLPYLNPTYEQYAEFKLPKWRVLSDVISDLSECDNKEHILIPQKRLKFYKLLKNGENWRNLPLELQEDALGKAYHLGGGKTGFYRRLDMNKPSPTLVTSPLMPATSLVHPYLNRSLSIAEYKRIQSFPDEWVFAGNTLSKFKQIGNAVPPLLGEAIAKVILNREHKADVNPPENFAFSRYKNTSELI